MIEKITSLTGRTKLFVAGAVVALTLGGVTAALNQPQTTGADTSPLTQEVDRQGEQLNNHEARITNTENDVKDLQNNTGTASSTNKVYVPVPSSTTPVITSTPTVAPAPAQNPAPKPITVVQSDIGYDTSSHTFCELHYSDGTTAEVIAPSTGQGDTFQDNCATLLGQPKN